MFSELLNIEKNLYGRNTMDRDERSVDVIMNGILKEFQHLLTRSKVLRYVKRYGVVEAQQRLLELVM